MVARERLVKSRTRGALGDRQLATPCVMSYVTARTFAAPAPRSPAPHHGARSWTLLVRQPKLAPPVRPVPAPFVGRPRHAVSPMPARELFESEVLRGVCRSASSDLHELQYPGLTDRQVLS